MNVSFYLRRAVLYLVLFITPFAGFAQVEYHNVLVNDSLHYNFESIAISAQIDVTPTNGDYIFNGSINYPLGLTGDNELIYIPDTDFLGTDTISVLYYEDGPTGPTQSFVTLVICVIESYVIAKNDYIATSINTPVSIAVIPNDDASGTLTIQDAPLVNNGTATVNGDSILFTPSNNFEGTANLAYTVCDEAYNICDVATITVFIQPSYGEVDTTTLVTLMNQETKALFPVNEGIQELLSPTNGGLRLSDGGVDYIPDPGFVGMDTFTYAYNISTSTSVITYYVDVLATEEPNSLVVNDRGYTSINDSMEIDVLENDLNNDLAILTFTSQSEDGGQVTHLGNGLFKYIPPSSTYSGVDFFEYTAFIPGTSTEETGIAYIIVTNHKPFLSSYSINTPKNTPLVIDYNIPIDNFDFTIETQSQSGLVEYYPGEFSSYNLLINGQEVEGYNLLVYYPDTDFVGLDDFTIEYCVGTDCKVVDVFTEVIEIANPQADTLCVSDCVWPGDANADGSVDIIDVLPIGYCVGEVGEERTNGSSDWYGQFGTDWDGMIGTTGINIKHVDANGDGYISSADTATINQAYGKYNNLTVAPEPVASQIPLFFVPRTPNAAPGEKVIIDIVLGTENLPAMDIHGITFALNFNEDIVEPGTMEVLYSSNNWLAYESAMLSMKQEPTLGRVESAYSRATGISQHGYGTIGQVSFIVVEDIIDGVRLRDTLTRLFTPSTLLSMDAAGQYVKLMSQPFELKFAHDIKGSLDDENRFLITYPNPTTDHLNIHVNGNNELEQILVHSITGQQVFMLDDLEGKSTSFTFDSNIANGIYLVTAVCDKGVYTKKVELFR